MSVRPSVYHTRALWQNQSMHCGHFDTSLKGKHSSFLTPTVVGGRCPLPSEICAKSDPLLFEIRRLRQISAYNVSTVRDSEKVQLWRIRSPPRAFQRAVYTLLRASSTAIHIVVKINRPRWSAYVTPKPQRVAQLKGDYCLIFKN